LRNMSEELIELPTGWVWTALEELLRHKNALTYGILKPGDYVSDGVPMLRIMDIGDGKLNDTQLFRVSKALDEEYQRTSLETGDVVLAVMATIGRTMVIPKSLQGANVNRALAVLKLSHLVTPEFICWSLRSPYFQKIFIDNQLGTAQKRINLAELRKFSVALPPLNEQRCIVAKIEALKARSQRVKEELEAIAPLLDQFRQSVLAAAFRGDLTGDWRQKNPDIEPVTRVVESLREKRFSQARTPAQLQKLNEIYSSQEEEDSNLLPESWRYIALEKLCDSFQYGTSAKSLASGKVPVLRMGNIQNGEIDGSDLVYTSDEDEIEKYKLKIGDVLFNRTNSPELVGKTGIYRGEHQAIFAGYLIKINNTQELDSEYLNYCLNTGYAKEYCWRVKTDGVSQSNINAQKLGKFELPFCSLEEQREVVRRINSLFLVANRLKQNYKEAKAYLDQLDRSILAKAFRGELVPQDPNDEPASVLLERIRAEREKLDTKKKAKGKTEKKSRKAKPEPVEPEQLSLPGFE